MCPGIKTAYQGWRRLPAGGAPAAGGSPVVPPTGLCVSVCRPHSKHARLLHCGYRNLIRLHTFHVLNMWIIAPTCVCALMNLFAFDIFEAPRRYPPTHHTPVQCLYWVYSTVGKILVVYTQAPTQSDERAIVCETLVHALKYKTSERRPITEQSPRHCRSLSTGTTSHEYCISPPQPSYNRTHLYL